MHVRVLALALAAANQLISIDLATGGEPRPSREAACMHVLRRPDIEHLHRRIHAYPNRPPACVLVGSWIDRARRPTDPL